VGIISALPRRIRPPRALIGVQFNPASSVPKIGSIMPGLGAESAGLKPGDIILAVDGANVTNREQLVESIRELREGRLVKLRVERETKPFDVEVRLQVPKPGELGSDSPEARSTQLNGEVSRRAAGFEQAIEHDSVLAPWLCGGPLVN